MSDNVLTPEELEALREGMPQQDRRAPEDIDLVRSDRQIRRRLGAIERQLSLFAHSATAHLAKALRTPCDAAPAPLEVVGPRMAQEALQTQVVLYKLLNDGYTFGYLGLDNSLCFRLVEAAFGAKVNSTMVVPERSKLTLVERDTIYPVVRDIVTLMAKQLSIGQPLQLDFKVCELVPELDADESLVSWGLTAESQGSLGSLALFFTPASVEFCTYEGREPTGKGKEKIAKVLRDTSIELSAVLGNCDVPLSELLSLRSGDVVRLDRNQNEPVPVLLEGVAKYVAQPVERNGVYGVEIERSLQ